MPTPLLSAELLAASPPTVVPLHGAIRSDAAGFRRLVELYNQLRTLSTPYAFLDFSTLSWLDANQSALIGAIQHLLRLSEGPQLLADHTELQTRFEVLLRNGCFVLPAGYEAPTSSHTTAIKVKPFLSTDTIAFYQYLSDELFAQPDLRRSISDADRDAIISHLFDIFANVDLHARTDRPVFACGQYYPKTRCLHFTIADLGVGYLPTIRAFTEWQRGEHPQAAAPVITTAGEAIRWAVRKGTTTKPSDTPGGSGLYNLCQYCAQTGGSVSIVTGGEYFTLVPQQTLATGAPVGTLVPVPMFDGSLVQATFYCAAN